MQVKFEAQQQPTAIQLAAPYSMGGDYRDTHYKSAHTYADSAASKFSSTPLKEEPSGRYQHGNYQHGNYQQGMTGNFAQDRSIQQRFPNTSGEGQNYDPTQKGWNRSWNNQDVDKKDELF